jgi:hypothetical protein
MANDIIDIIVTDNSDNVQLNVTPNLVSINVSQTSGNIIGSNYYLASTFSALPITGDLTTLYVINDTSLMYRWSGSAYTQINSSAVVAWGQITGTLSGQTDLQNALNAKAPLASPTFTGTVSGITKSMVGLSNVDNTSDVNKPISTATQTALNLKADINNPTFTGTVGGITKAMVGLGNVDNTSDVNKPISSATQTALDTKAPLASPTFTGTVSGITKSMVGLGNVDNTTDLLKPISTATQSALNLKYDASNPSGYTTNVGTVTSVGGTGTVSGLSLSGTVTTSGNLTLGGTLSLTSGNVTTALGYTPENSANKGIANGYASLDGGGLVPSTQLPSYVDDVLEFADLAAFPASGTTGKIYVALDTNKIYRWSGATYIEVSPTVGTIWGGITGTLSNQTDLQNALNAKQNNLSGTGFVKSTAGTISYDTSTYYPYPTGNTTQYVAGDGSLIAFPVAGQAGTLVRLVRNQTGATLTKGTVVYITGATGNNPIVEKALATGDSTSAQTFGLCQANIANNAEGYVVLTGDLTGIDTSAFTEGQQLYLSPTTAGTYTATKQYAPNHLVYIGVITRAHPTLGQIEVKIQNGYELDEIHNVSAQSPANNDIIAFNTSNNLWEKKSIATALGFTPYNATNPNNYIALTELSSSATGLTYTNTTGVFSLTAGYAIPTTASATNWDTAYTNRITSLTTTGSSGSATLVSNVLNIPTYTLSGLGGITASFLSGTSGISYNSTTGVISTSLTQYTDALARASVSLTTTGTSGNSTYNSTTGVLNIPNYGSALSGYLPLTGGTLTGALGGTSASFSDTISITANSSTAYSLNLLGRSVDNATTLNFFSNNGATRYGFIYTEPTTMLFGVNGAVRLSIASTGAATFSSSVTAGGNLILSGSDARINGGDSVGRLLLTNSNTTTYIGLYGATHPTLPYIMSFVVNAATALTIASTGAATFSSSISATSGTFTGRIGTSLSSSGVNLNNSSFYLNNTAGTKGAIFGYNDTADNFYFTVIQHGVAYRPLVINSSATTFSSGITSTGLSTNMTNGTILLRDNGTAQVEVNIRHTNSRNGVIGFTHDGVADRWAIGTKPYDGSLYFSANFDLSTPRFIIASGGAVTINSLGSGAVTATSGVLSTTSDMTLKIEDGYIDNALEKISKLKPRYFYWKEESGLPTDIRQLGFYAQEVNQALGEEAANTPKNKNDKWGIYDRGIIAMLTKAVQELSAEITILKNK